MLVENAARGLVVEGVKMCVELEKLAVGRLRATSIAKGFVEAIILVVRGEVVEVFGTVPGIINTIAVIG
jgi:hypothetical protein